jgi:CheY-like chemotaxis protein
MSTGLSTNLFARPERHRPRIDGKRILYVDDELLLRLAATRLLRGAGAVCVSTETHDQAVVLLAFEPLIDLAILDFQMPDGDVDRLIPRLRWQRPDLTLVGTSGSDRRSEFATRGVDRFLAKPWSLDDLIRVAGWSEPSVGRVPVAGS